MKKSYRVDEAAAELEVSRRTVERMIRDRQIESFKIRDARRIAAEELDRVKKKEQATL